MNSLKDRAERARYRQRALRARAAGLAAHGTPRRREVLTDGQRRYRARVRWQKRAAARQAAGLTTRGAQPRNRRWTELDHLNGKSRNRARDRQRYRQSHPHLLPSPKERAWRELRESMNIHLPELAPWLERSETAAPQFNGASAGKAPDSPAPALSTRGAVLTAPL